MAEEFDKDPEWTKERLYELSMKTGLSEAQIYKWGWDQRKKNEDLNKREEKELTKAEVKEAI